MEKKPDEKQEARAAEKHKLEVTLIRYKLIKLSRELNLPEQDFLQQINSTVNVDANQNTQNEGASENSLSEVVNEEMEL